MAQQRLFILMTTKYYIQHNCLTFNTNCRYLNNNLKKKFRLLNNLVIRDQIT